MSEASLLQVRDLIKHFRVHAGVFSRRAGTVRAVDGVTFTLHAGETLGLVGESGCGKSTTGRAVVRLIDPTSGSIRLRGKEISHLNRSAVRPYRREMQIIFQDAFSSLNPRMTAADIVGEPLANFPPAAGSNRTEVVAGLFERVGLGHDQLSKYPHEFSGGQRQRLSIARALSINPHLIVCDEPVSALDVSVQAQIVNLLTDLQEDYGLAYLFISHDLAVVEHISHRVAVMYLGKIVELADKRSLFLSPQHPYTEALLAATPPPEPRSQRERHVISGDVPSPMKPPDGCRFHTRCPYVEQCCQAVEPLLQDIAPGHFVACHRRQPLTMFGSGRAETSS